MFEYIKNFLSGVFYRVTLTNPTTGVSYYWHSRCLPTRQKIMARLIELDMKYDCCGLDSGLDLDDIVEALRTYPFLKQETLEHQFILIEKNEMDMLENRNTCGIT